MNSIDHPDIVQCSGGGICPEQHEGTLKDGRYFYLRYRSAVAKLAVSKTPMGPDQFWDVYYIVDHHKDCAIHNGQSCSFWDRRCPFRSEHIFKAVDMLAEGYTDSEYEGCFWDRGQRNTIFARLLGEINEDRGDTPK